MNDEIREKIKAYYVANDIDEIIDYITNLQHTEDLYNQLLKDYDELQQELEEYKDTETYSKKFLYKANKDRLNANLDLVKENERLKQDYINLKNYIVLRKVDTEVQDKATLYNIELENINKKRYEDYKSRVEKAVEYLKSKEDSLFMTFSDDVLDHDELIDKKIGTTLLNILNGEK